MYKTILYNSILFGFEERIIYSAQFQKSMRHMNIIFRVMFLSDIQAFEWFVYTEQGNTTQISEPPNNCCKNTFWGIF